MDIQWIETDEKWILKGYSMDSKWILKGLKLDSVDKSFIINKNNK